MTNKTKALLLVWFFMLFGVALEAEQSIIHPVFPLIDAQGEHVLKSGEPLSSAKTCGECHDVQYIEQHNYHSFLGLKEFNPRPQNFQGYPWEQGPGLFGSWSPLTYRSLSAKGDKNIDLGTPDWIKLFGAYHTGGGLSVYGRDGKSLLNLKPGDTAPDNPETSFEEYPGGNRKTWNWQKSGIVDINCFLCHLDKPDNESRIAMIQSGDFKWATSATLSKTEIIKKQNDKWVWNPESFDKEGNLKRRFISVRDPKSKNCGLCHKMAQDTPDINIWTNKNLLKESPAGQIFSPYRISQSSMNLKDKVGLSRSWDIHAERLLDCNSCHFSVNNPAFYQESKRTRPSHLIFDGRKISPGEFVKRPSHKLANMRIRCELENMEPDNVMRRCENCHDPYSGHKFLPYKKRHIWALGCESCHIPKVHIPALKQIDWTVLTLKGEPRKEFRGIEIGKGNNEKTNLITGYNPTWFTRNLAQKSSLLPYNLVTSWFWTGKDPLAPVQQSVLKKVFLENGQYRPEITKLFDDNKNGIIDDKELALDSAAKVDFIKVKLESLGVLEPKIQAEIRPFAIHHGVVGRKGAIKDCYECHGGESRFTAEFSLASYIPGGIIPGLAPRSFIKLEGDIKQDENKALVFYPKPKERGIYLLGSYRNSWIDIIGLINLLGVISVIALHAGLRIAKRKDIRHKKVQLKKMYMYPVYERLWHWLQAGTIIMFAITGLEIRFVELFPIMGFETAVRIHEIVAIIFIINAIVSISYHITAGEIKHYLPDSKSFIDESWKQVVFYLKGIFQGADHPVAKTPEKRLNALQQVTYLMILYGLIPVQLATGILLWGAERWPDLIGKLGGLTVIAPIHSLCAWFFISFIVMHIYLTTTGHTPMANMTAMITGWEDVETKDTRS